MDILYVLYFFILPDPSNRPTLTLCFMYEYHSSESVKKIVYGDEIPQK